MATTPSYSSYRAPSASATGTAAAAATTTAAALTPAQQAQAQAYYAQYYAQHPAYAAQLASAAAIAAQAAAASASASAAASGAGAGAGTGVGLPMTVADNYESWYMESTASNRMVLSLRSGVARDTEWALERLLHLTKDWPERFWMKTLPGIGDALYDLAEYILHNPRLSWAGEDGEMAWKRKSAIEAMLVLRNASLQEHNMHYLEKAPRTFPLILHTLQLFGPGGKREGEEAEFLLYTIELFHSLAPRYHLKPGSALLRALGAITAPTQEDRTLLRAALAALTALFSSTYNAHLITLSSPGFEAALRILPVQEDPPSLIAAATGTAHATSLQHAALDQMHTFLSHPAVAHAFFRHPKFAGTLRLLVGIVLSHQPAQPDPTPAYTPPPPPDPATSGPPNPRQLTQQEIQDLLPLPEPRRAEEWMRKVFVPDANASVTQVNFWNLYKDVFQPPASASSQPGAVGAAEGGAAAGGAGTSPGGGEWPYPPPLTASDLIKSVTLSFPHASAQVLPSRHPPVYVIRGIRQRGEGEMSRFACRWFRGGCRDGKGGLREGKWEMRGREELGGHLWGVHLGGSVAAGRSGPSQAGAQTGGASEGDADAEGEDMDADGELDADADADGEADADADGEPDEDAMQTDPPAPAQPSSNPTAPPAATTATPTTSAAQDQVPDIIPNPSAPQECTWSTCQYVAPNLAALRRHVLIHLPSETPEPTKISSRSSTLPPTSNNNSNSNSSLVAAAPSVTASVTASASAAAAPLDPIATSALLVLHLLFREAYPTPLPHSVSSQPGSGFPFASLLSQPSSAAPPAPAASAGPGATDPSAQHPTQAVQELDASRDNTDIESERLARSVFRNLVNDIDRIKVNKNADPDGILLRWVEEMRWRVKADAFLELKGR